MKAFLPLASSLALSALLLTAHAQTGPSGADKAALRQQTADHRAAAYKGPKVVKDSKKLGREFIRDSKPAPKAVSPAKE